MSNPFANVRWIWKNGQLVDFEKATVHAMSHALHYGSGVFEGIRCYKTRRGPAVFRLAEHLDRLEYSARIYRMPMPFSRDEMAEAVLETIRANELESCYIRPLVYRGFGTMGVNPLKSPVEAMVAVWSWGKYLGESGQGVDVGVSTWRRPASDSLPAIAKSTGGYLNSQLIKMEALANGFVEGIALDSQGFISEGSGENLFLVRRGTLISPALAASVLDGITRDAVITMAREMGIPVREELVPRALLYVCDELFMTGTAAEITPIRSVDHYSVGRTCPGEITRRLLDTFMAVVTGETEDRHGWLTPVNAPAAPTAATADVPAAAMAGEAS